MKIKLLLLFIFSGLLMSSCSSEMSFDTASEGTKEIHDVIRTTSQNLVKKYPIHPIGFGMAAMNEVEKLSLSFEVRQKMPKDELRLMLIDCVNEMITIVNQNEEIQPYLSQEGFGYKSVEIVFFVTNGKKELFDPDISVAGYYSGYIGFKTKIPEQEYGYHQEDEETYEEAIAILESQGHQEVLLEPALCKPGSMYK